ncbi:ATP-binding protein [Candidatus Neomarinimicrobiota bacterium]
MIYHDLILHSEQWHRLVESFNQERLAHAHLFYGPAGSGKEGHAIELAALVNCLEPGREGACGRCSSCRKVQGLQHPNIQLVTPLPRRVRLTKNDPPLKALKPADLDDLADQLASKAQDPYFTIRLTGAQSILINSVRELRRTVYLKPGERGWRAILIFEAEKLCTGEGAAANALLKLLEEPPSWTVFVLVTDRPHLLLPTIRSRCLALYFPALTVDQTAGYLVEQHGLDKERARILAQVTGGNLPQARQLQENGEQPLQDLDELVGSLLAAKPARWQQVMNDLALLHRNRSLEFTYRLQLLQTWLRDLMVLQKTGDEGRMVFGRRMADLRRCLDTWPEADWAAATAAIEPTLNNLERNINPTLTLTNMILEVREALSPRDAWSTFGDQASAT